MTSFDITSHKFYVIQIKYVKYHQIKKLVCVPRSWIKWRMRYGNVIVKYPIETPSVTARRVEEEQGFLDHWSIFKAAIKHATNDYNDALNYICTPFRQRKTSKTPVRRSQRLLNLTLKQQTSSKENHIDVQNGTEDTLQNREGNLRDTSSLNNPRQAKLKKSVNQNPDPEPSTSNHSPETNRREPNNDNSAFNIPNSRETTELNEEESVATELSEEETGEGAVVVEREGAATQTYNAKCRNTNCFQETENTLRYHEPRPDLDELGDSGIFVSKAGLNICKALARTRRHLIVMLLPEVFTFEALCYCSLDELHQRAITALLDYTQDSEKFRFTWWEGPNPDVKTYMVRAIRKYKTKYISYLDI